MTIFCFYNIEMLMFSGVLPQKSLYIFELFMNYRYGFH
jgi:hypothetical protein